MRRVLRGVGSFISRHRRPFIGIAVLCVSGVLVLAAINAYILLSAHGDFTDDVDEVPPSQTALVLGAQVKADGSMSLMLSDRVEAAVRLWESGKVERILVSGDHGDWAYDEPDTMRMALQRAGVPDEVIFEDHAGFDTWSSVVRAEEVFNVSDAVIVTQGFHMSRALYLADAAGLDATGFTSDLHPYGSRGTSVKIREVLARVKALGDAVLDSEVMLGPDIPITGDGRSSWGPAPPPGTPPAGAPRATS
jgi:SanA protein